jgi:hypothetical protein
MVHDVFWLIVEAPAGADAAIIAATDPSTSLRLTR